MGIPGAVLLAVLMASSPPAHQDGRKSEQIVRTGHVRGRPIEIVLVEIGPGHHLEVEASLFFLWMTKKAAEHALELKVRSAFRGFEKQRKLYRCFIECSCNGCRRAARPGYSPHETGQAIDLDVSDPKVLAWLAANAKRFGFARPVRDEPWHFEFVGLDERSDPSRRAF